MPGHNGGFNPNRDKNGEFTEPGNVGGAGRSRAGGPAAWVALPKSDMNEKIRAATGRGAGSAVPTVGLPSVAAGDAAHPTRGPGGPLYEYPKGKHTREALAQGAALNAGELEHARRLLASGVRNVEVVDAGDGKGTMALATAFEPGVPRGRPWMTYTVLDPATRGTKAERWLGIPRGAKKDPQTGLVTEVISEAVRAREFVRQVNAGADFRETLKAFNGGTNPADNTHFGDPMSEAQLAPFHA